jgi:acetyltransferase
MNTPYNDPAAAIAASRRAAGLTHRTRLRNGVPVHIRPVRPADVRCFGEFICKLSTASRGWRFQGGVSPCAPGLLQELVHVDGVNHVCSIATRPAHLGAAGEEVLGEARYCVDVDTDCAELAIAVADTCQGQGLADELLAHLLDAARDAGLRCLFCEVPSANARMIRFMQRMGFVVCERVGEGSVLRMEREVAPRAPQGAAPRALLALRRWLGSQFSQEAH